MSFPELTYIVAIAIIFLSATSSYQLSFHHRMSRIEISGTRLNMIKKNKKVSQQKGKMTKTKKENNNAKNTSNAWNAKNIKDPKKLAHKSKPPWQVMSRKDMTKNAEKLKTRREKIKNGEEVEEMEMIGQADMSQSNRLLPEDDRKLLSWRRFSPYKDTSGLVFVGSYLTRRLPPRMGVPEIAFLGRSNVGKSSLLNKLVSVSNTENSSSSQARVGKTPGATASVNLYALLGKSKTTLEADAKPVLGLVDLPGFGYAKLSKDVKNSVEEAAEQYLDKRKELALGIILLDARRVPSQEDKEVLNSLYDMGLPLSIVVTKIDKIKSFPELEQCLKLIQQELDLPAPPLVISSLTGQGIKDLWKIILEASQLRINEIKGLQTQDEQNQITTLSRLDYIEDEDVHYDQAYEWSESSQDSIIDPDDDQYDEFELTEDEPNEDESNNQFATTGQDAHNFKSLKKIARNMDRRGEI